MSEVHGYEYNLLLNLPLATNYTEFNFDDKFITNGEYEKILNSDFSKSTFYTTEVESFDLKLKEQLNNKPNDKSWICSSVASLLYFIKNNWVGPMKCKKNDYLTTLRDLALEKLSLNDQIDENVIKPELLYISKMILNNEKVQLHFPTALWWSLRANYIHQLILDETSDVLFQESERLIEIISKSNLMDDPILNTLFCVEVSQFYLCYGRIQSSEKYLEDAKTIAKVSFELQGALGKRTKYQSQDKPQLYLSVKVGKDLFSYRDCDGLPKVINISDDVLLEEVEFTNEKETVKLGGIEETIVLGNFFLLQKSQPKDNLMSEELLPYLDYIIQNTGNWALKVSALFQRSILESNNKRTIERALAQVEYLIIQLKGTETPANYRLDLFFASGLKPIWFYQQHLAKVMINLGLVKSALDLYLSLSLWEDVIVCYTILEQKDKAANIIRQELEKNPTVKLWCLLGDATQEVKHYETAWKLSGEKSSRVQRHWGLYYYAKQQYAEAVPHLKLSVELNNIQENVWVRLGFAALQIEDWNLAASAYRKYCALEQSSFEVWNNLAKAYIKLGDKSRAYKALQDAIKCNFDKWEVWDNLMTVSIDLGHFYEVIRCYHRILDLKGAYVDVQVLSILSRAVINEITDSEGNSARRCLQKTLELFGRLTAVFANDPEVWRLYGEVALLKDTDLDHEKAFQYFERAYRAAVSNARWCQTVEDANKVLDLSARLGEVAITYFEKCTVTRKREILGRAKLILQSVVKKIKDLMWEDESGIVDNLSKVQHHLSAILAELEKLKNL